MVSHRPAMFGGNRHWVSGDMFLVVEEHVPHALTLLSVCNTSIRQCCLLRLHVTQNVLQLSFCFSCSFFFSLPFSDKLAKVIFKFYLNCCYKHVWPGSEWLIWYAMCLQTISYRDRQCHSMWTGPDFRKVPTWPSRILLKFCQVTVTIKKWKSWKLYFLLVNGSKITAT